MKHLKRHLFFEASFAACSCWVPWLTVPRRTLFYLVLNNFPFFLSTRGKSREVRTQNLSSSWINSFFLNRTILYSSHTDQFSTSSPGWKNPHKVDCTWGDSLPEVLFSKWCVELRHCNVGGDVLRWETILGDVQPGCKYCPALICKLLKCFFKIIVSPCPALLSHSLSRLQSQLV